MEGENRLYGSIVLYCFIGLNPSLPTPNPSANSSSAS